MEGAREVRSPPPRPSSSRRSESVWPSGADSPLRRVPSFQGKFHVRVKALEYVGGQHVCSLPERDRQGVIHVKPTSLSDSLRVTAAVACDACPCEQVREGACCGCLSCSRPDGGGKVLAVRVGPPRPLSAGLRRLGWAKEIFIAALPSWARSPTAGPALTAASAPWPAFLTPETVLGAAEPTWQRLLSLRLQQREFSSPKCSFHGDFVCGQCICHPGW